MPTKFTLIGGYGFAGVLRNGLGKTVLLRADIDALPVKELTSLPYASSVTMNDTNGIEQPVVHAYGHDMHITCLLAAAETLASIRDDWSGTLIVLFQPNEERGEGAQAMVDDGLYSKIPVPDYVFGQHVMRMRAGSVGSRPGTIMAAADSLKITLYGRGGHGSLPHQTVDPVILAANVVVRLQSIVSREIDPSDLAVVTVGSLRAGQAENVIPDTAELGVDFRLWFSKPPVFTPTFNDEQVTAQLAASFGEHFKDFDGDTPRTNVSEDFSILGTSYDRPCSFWFIGCIDQDLWDEPQRHDRLAEIAGNHSALFAPVIQPTLKTGVDALCIAALTFLGK